MVFYGQCGISKRGHHLFFGHGDQDKVGYHHFHFDRQDPHSTAAALDTCTLVSVDRTLALDPW